MQLYDTICSLAWITKKDKTISIEKIEHIHLEALEVIHGALFNTKNIASELINFCAGDIDHKDLAGFALAVEGSSFFEKVISENEYDSINQENSELNQMIWYDYPLQNDYYLYGIKRPHIAQFHCMASLSQLVCRYITTRRRVALKLMQYLPVLPDESLSKPSRYLHDELLYYHINPSIMPFSIHGCMEGQQNLNELKLIWTHIGLFLLGVEQYG